ncbi:hypothetical protein EHRUM3_10990 [Ehrlichia ruminantium]|uniref:Uncharacterized protein n=3 Tax=Ehrlichia ruminantium TaxID=779 RepID=A0A170TGX7_EHRRU|nr:hypothetical protein EHRUM3_10990 [Ehrlichia ruminantium]
MYGYSFNIIKNLVYLLLFYVGSINICVLAYGKNIDEKMSLDYQYLSFFDNRVTIEDLSYKFDIGIGECKGTGDGLINFVVYADENDFFHPQLCICRVSSCNNLSEIKSDWHLTCSSRAICHAMPKRSYPIPFCSGIFQDKDIIRFVPIEFSSQTFFNPGIRIIELKKGKMYEDEVFLSYNDFLVKNGRLEFTGDFYGFKAYMVDGNKICIENPQEPQPLRCVPIPVLTQLVLSKYKYNQMKIQFLGTAPLKESIIRDNIDLIIRPKINLNNHQFYLKGKLQDNKIFNLSNCCMDGKIKYQRDNRVQVKCIDGINEFNTVFGYTLKIHEGKYDRYIWLRPLYSRMVRYARTRNKKYIQCADYEHDLKDKKQDFLDRVLINEDGYYFFSNAVNTDVKLNMYEEDNPCNNLENSFYLYQNYKLRLRNEKSWEFPPEVLTQYYSEQGYFSADVVRFFNADSKEEISLDVKLQNDLELLDYYSMGMCVDNFKNVIYAAKDNTSENNLFLKNKVKITRDRDVDIWLYYPKFTNVYNVSKKCDFIKVEILGGGQSGEIDAETGKSKEGVPGEYVMGMFKIGKSDQYFVKIHFDVNNGNSIGSDSMIEFCKRKKHRNSDVEVCEVKLVANGGGKLPNDKIKNIISNDTVHDRNMLYYRVVSNNKNRILSNIPSNKRVRFIPYQNFVQDILFEELSDDECIAGSLLMENTSKYFGAGGCADISTHSTEKGAGGMVKITCENWYN